MHLLVDFIVLSAILTSTAGKTLYSVSIGNVFFNLY